MSEMFIAFVLLLAVLVAAVVVRFSPVGVRTKALTGLTAWVGYATVMGSLGPQFLPAGVPPLPILLALPAVGLVMFCAGSQFGGRLAAAIPASVLIGLESFRIVVEIVLHELSDIGLVPKMLTYEGSNFDVLIGLSAPFVAWLQATKRLAPRRAIAWNLIGIAMVANVVVRSILTTPGPTHLIDTEIANQAVRLFPYTFIPGLLAPLAVLLHVLAIRGLRSSKSQSIINRQPPIDLAALKEQPMKSLPSNPVVLITGASRGIGREIALAYAKRGARLVLAARTAEALAAVGREVEAIGAEVLALPTDITSLAAVDMLITGATERFGRIDVLVNNAGIGRVGSVTDAGFERDVHATLNASLFGMIHLTQRVVPIMRTQNSGAIVNMSSVMGRKAFARFGSYAIAMHAVSAFSDALRQELAGTGIQVAVIHPALTATELLRDATVSEMPPPFKHMTPLSAEKVAAAIVSAVTRRKRRVVLPWQANMLLLGEAISPWLGDLIARALTVRLIARSLGMSRGPTYHDMLAPTGR